MNLSQKGERFFQRLTEAYLDEMSDRVVDGRKVVPWTMWMMLRDNRQRPPGPVVQNIVRKHIESLRSQGRVKQVDHGWVWTWKRT